MKSSHDEIRELIALSLSDDANQKELRSIEDHLMACEACRSERNSMRKWYDDLKDESNPPEIDVWYAVRREIISEAPIVHMPSRRITWLQKFAYTTVAALIFFSIIFFLRNEPGEEPAPVFTGSIVAEAYIDGVPASTQVVETDDGGTYIFFQ